MSVLGLRMSFPPYLSSAMERFPFASYAIKFSIAKKILTTINNWIFSVQFARSVRQKEAQNLTIALLWNMLKN